MFNGKNDKQSIKSIEVLDDVSHEDFLQECLALGVIAASLAQVQEAIEHCECDDIDLTFLKTQFSKDYDKMVGWLKEGKIEEVLNEIKGYAVAYKNAHLEAINKDYEKHKLPSALDGALSGITTDDTTLN